MKLAMIRQYSPVCLLLISLVRMSIQRCTTEEFDNLKALDLIQNTESSETSQNFTIRDIIYNCLATSQIIGIYTSMSVSILYNRSDSPDVLRDVRYNLLCSQGKWHRYGQHPGAFNESRADCYDCVMAVNESDHHCSR